MSTKRQLARRLGVVAGFDEPDASLEQYRTPPGVAAYLVHLADLNGDVAGRTVVDLGAGTGMITLAAALRDPARVVGVDIDPKPLSTARANQDRIGTETRIAWLRADAADLPLCLAEPVTVVMNPPFGAQSGNEHADRRFLGTAAEISTVSYSIHNAGSTEFVESFTADNDGEVTAAYRSTLSLPRQFAFHDDDKHEIDVELFRIEW